MTQFPRDVILKFKASCLARRGSLQLSLVSRFLSLPRPYNKPQLLSSSPKDYYIYLIPTYTHTKEKKKKEKGKIKSTNKISLVVAFGADRSMVAVIIVLDWPRSFVTFHTIFFLFFRLLPRTEKDPFTGRSRCHLSSWQQGIRGLGFQQIKKAVREQDVIYNHSCTCWLGYPRFLKAFLPLFPLLPLTHASPNLGIVAKRTYMTENHWTAKKHVNRAVKAPKKERRKKKNQVLTNNFTL